MSVAKAKAIQRKVETKNYQVSLSDSNTSPTYEREASESDGSSATGSSATGDTDEPGHRAKRIAQVRSKVQNGERLLGLEIDLYRHS